MCLAGCSKYLGSLRRRFGNQKGAEQMFKHISNVGHKVKQNWCWHTIDWTSLIHDVSEVGVWHMGTINIVSNIGTWHVRKRLLRAEF